MSQERKIEGFVALFDILGFQNSLPSDDDLDMVSEILHNLINEIENYNDHINKVLDLEGIKEDIIHFRNYADTILIHTEEVSDKGFEAIIAACGFVFNVALEAGMPIRGATGVGKMVNSDKLIFGRPIIDAYKNEQNQDWIGCWISQECTNRITLSALEMHKMNRDIVLYPIPLKKGDVKKEYAFNWVESLNKQKYDQIKDRFFKKGTPHEWPAERKLKNTKEFRGFVENLREPETN